MKQALLGLATPEEREALERLLRLPQLRDYSDDYMRQVLQECGGDVTLAASVLGVGRASLYRWIKRLQAPRSAANDAKRAARVRKQFLASRGKW